MIAHSDPESVSTVFGLRSNDCSLLPRGIVYNGRSNDFG